MLWLRRKSMLANMSLSLMTFLSMIQTTTGNAIDRRSQSQGLIKSGDTATVCGIKFRLLGHEQTYEDARKLCETECSRLPQYLSENMQEEAFQLFVLYNVTGSVVITSPQFQADELQNGCLRANPPVVRMQFKQTHHLREIIIYADSSKLKKVQIKATPPCHYNFGSHGVSEELPSCDEYTAALKLSFQITSCTDLYLCGIYFMAGGDTTISTSTTTDTARIGTDITSSNVYTTSADTDSTRTNTDTTSIATDITNTDVYTTTTDVYTTTTNTDTTRTDTDTNISDAYNNSTDTDTMSADTDVTSTDTTSTDTDTTSTDTNTTSTDTDTTSTTTDSTSTDIDTTNTDTDSTSTDIDTTNTDTDSTSTDIDTTSTDTQTTTTTRPTNTFVEATAEPLGVDHMGRKIFKKCTCRCRNPKAAPSKPEAVAEKVTELKKNVSVNIKDLTKSVLKKRSRVDKRSSPGVIGWTCLIVVALPFMALLFGDIFTVVKWLCVKIAK